MNVMAMITCYNPVQTGRRAWRDTAGRHVPGRRPAPPAADAGDVARRPVSGLLPTALSNGIGGQVQKAAGDGRESRGILMGPILLLLVVVQLLRITVSWQRDNIPPPITSKPVRMDIPGLLTELKEAGDAYNRRVLYELASPFPECSPCSLTIRTNTRAAPDGPRQAQAMTSNGSIVQPSAGIVTASRSDHCQSEARSPAIPRGRSARLNGSVGGLGEDQHAGTGTGPKRPF